MIKEFKSRKYFWIPNEMKYLSSKGLADMYCYNDNNNVKFTKQVNLH